jgi:hypothetical protein
MSMRESDMAAVPAGDGPRDGVRRKLWSAANGGAWVAQQQPTSDDKFRGHYVMLT